ncbi:hypothetical protein D3C85_1458340 [compost metagenome]
MTRFIAIITAAVTGSLFKKAMSTVIAQMTKKMITVARQMTRCPLWMASLFFMTAMVLRDVTQSNLSVRSPPLTAIQPVRFEVSPWCSTAARRRF